MCDENGNEVEYSYRRMETIAVTKKNNVALVLSCWMNEDMNDGELCLHGLTADSTMNGFLFFHSFRKPDPPVPAFSSVLYSLAS
jgi:hypothetical protein